MDGYANIFPDYQDPAPGTSACQCWPRMGIVGSGTNDNPASSGAGPFGLPWALLIAIAIGVVLLSQKSEKRGGS